MLELELQSNVPQVVALKFERAIRLYYLAWIDCDLMKTGELAGLIALELALKDRYGAKNFSRLLKHMCQSDGLDDSKIVMVQKYGATAIGRISGETHPSLSEMRNSLAHGDPFDGAPTSGLLELIRDLIDYVYRSGQ